MSLGGKYAFATVMSLALPMCIFISCSSVLCVWMAMGDRFTVFGHAISLRDFAYYIFGQETAVAMHLTIWYVVLVCHQYDVCENSVGSVYVGGYGGLSESGLCVFRELCPVSFLVVGESTSVLL